MLTHMHGELAPSHIPLWGCQSDLSVWWVTHFSQEPVIQEGVSQPEVTLCRTEPGSRLGLPSWFCAGDETLDLTQHTVGCPPRLTSPSPRSCLLRDKKEIRAEGRPHPQQGHRFYAGLPLHPHKRRRGFLDCQVGSEFLSASDPPASAS